MRADSNGDGAAELSDVVFTLGYLYLDGPAAPCQDAADGNDDGALDISDPVHFLFFLFAAGPQPPAPFPGCGEDPTADALGCVTQPQFCIPVDSDLDGLFDDEEASLGTNPQVADTDGDGLSDGAEVKTHLTSPLDDDSDDDGLEDGPEINLHHTLALDPDTDGDGYGDGTEVLSGTDPLNSASFPSAFPPDPSLVAPEVDAMVASSIFAATEFLYRGTPPIQTGVADGVIKPEHVAVLRGRAIDRDENPISGVLIAILGHPEFGQTRTRADGMFDMVVNGGGALVVGYESAAHLPAQRQIDVPWLDYRTLPDVVLIALDSAATAVDLTGPPQVARGSMVTDGDGSRQPTLLVPQGTSAQMVMLNGSQVPLTNLTIRATEDWRGNTHLTLTAILAWTVEEGMRTQDA